MKAARTFHIVGHLWKFHTLASAWAHTHAHTHTHTPTHARLGQPSPKANQSETNKKHRQSIPSKQFAKSTTILHATSRTKVRPNRQNHKQQIPPKLFTKSSTMSHVTVLAKAGPMDH